MTAPTWSTACPDWEQRIVDGRSLIPFPPLFPAEAEAALATFGALRMVDVAGSPTFAEAARPWIKDFIAAIFGAYDAETGRRLIRYFLLCVAKKNGKSTLSAGVMLTALLRNWRQEGEFLIVAPTIEIAGNSFKPALAMIKADPELASILHPQPNIRTITHRGTGATLKVVSADSQTVGGKKTIGLLVEELWQFGEIDGAEDMFREALGGLASRPEGFAVYISTHSDKPPAGAFLKTLREFRDIRDGIRADPRSLPIIYEYPRKYTAVDPETPDVPPLFHNPATWHIPNPNWGASVDPEFLAEQHSKDSLGGPASLNGFYAKHLNVEVGQAMRADNWPGARDWAQAAAPPITLDTLIERSEVIVLGVDGGGLDDLLGFAALGRERETRRWLLWTHAWVHKSALKLRKQIAPRLLDFENDGDLEIVDKMGDAFRALAKLCDRVNRAGLLHKVGFDPVGVKLIVDELAALELPITQEGGQVEGIPQGFRLQGAIKAAEDKLSDGEMKHGGQAMMAWVVGNAKIERRGNAILVTKAVSGIGKIDSLMAAFNCVALMSLNPEPLRGPSIYEKRGFLVV